MSPIGATLPKGLFLPQSRLQLKIQFHKNRAGDWIMTIRFDTLETERFVERHGLAHRAQGIQPHPLFEISLADENERMRLLDDFANRLRGDALSP